MARPGLLHPGLSLQPPLRERHLEPIPKTNPCNWTEPASPQRKDGDAEWKEPVFTAGNQLTYLKLSNKMRHPVGFLGALEGVTPRRLPDQCRQLPVFLDPPGAGLGL